LTTHLSLFPSSIVHMYWSHTEPCVFGSIALYFKKDAENLIKKFGG